MLVKGRGLRQAEVRGAPARLSLLIEFSDGGPGLGHEGRRRKGSPESPFRVRVGQLMKTTLIASLPSVALLLLALLMFVVSGCGPI